MSTATELTRLTNARNTIRDKLIDLGVATSTDKLDVLASAIDSITNRGAVSATVQEGDTYTIPAGYHNGSGTVSGVSGGGNYQLQSKTVTPTKAQQAITPDSGYYGLSDVTVSAIPDAYQNVSGVTVTASEVISGKVFVSATGSNVTGTMPNNGAVTKVLTTASTTYTVPTGYHNGEGLISIVLENKTVTPSTAEQSITPTTGKVLSKVTVEAIPANFANVADATAVASQLLEDEVAYSVDTNGVAQKITGTMPNNGAVSSTLSTATTQYIIPVGYHDGNGAVSITLESKSATPTTTTQSITPTAGKVLSKVVIDPIPTKYGDTTGDTATASDLLAGATAHTIQNGAAVQITGTMVNNGPINVAIDGLTTTTITIPEGYTTGGSVTLTSDIEEALAAI